MHTLLAVVVSHGGSPHLAELLGALADLAGCRAVLVENAPGYQHHDLPAGVPVYEGHGNIGYGAAVNLAVRRTLGDGAAACAPPEWLLVVNSDITIPDRTREMLPGLLAGTAADVDAVGFAVRSDDGRPGRSTAVLPRRRTNAFTALRGEPAAVARWPAWRYPVGAFFAIRTEAFLRIGGFDPEFWLYYEETDLFARLLAAGGRIGWCDPSWPVRHTGGATAGRAAELQRELGRAAVLYARRHRAGLGRGWLLVHVAQLLLLIARKVATGRRPDATRGARILAGLLLELAFPGREPAVRSRWRAVPATARRQLAALGDRRPPSPVPGGRHGG